MSAKFESGDVVRVLEPVIQGNVPDPNAEPYEKGWVYAQSNSLGRVVGFSGEKCTVLFRTTGTATSVDRSIIEKAENP